ncbi:hypothetical protein BaRGS_00003018 [Batillaria attramentaria]|uniref:BtpA family membrane complex biogenesis protein n=1 Tax=Batillaria attramentaria TaxID=370345 RepID=A0ABD0M2A8_9CAEN
MIHLRALPGTPNSNHSVQQIVDLACQEARVYKEAGLDAVMVENMHDVPYLHTSDVGPEITSTMSVVCLQFIRAEGFVFSHVADEGLMNACAGELMRYRRNIGAEDIMVFTDIKKKHSAHAITTDVDIVETARAASFFLSDGVIVTGSATGQVTSTKEVKAVLEGAQIPVLVGSGVTTENYEYYKSAHGVIVGSYFKYDGHWANGLDPERVRRFMERVMQVRKKHVDATMIM